MGLMTLNQIIKQMIDKIEQNVVSMQTLSKLRDTLLPKLMKGEIRAGSMQKSTRGLV